MIYKIRRSCCRFGNNIIQLINCLYIALLNGANRVEFDYDFLNTKSIELVLGDTIDTQIITGYFWSSDELKSICPLFDYLPNPIRIEIVNTYLRPLLIYEESPEYNYQTELFVHIRSGEQIHTKDMLNRLWIIM